MAADTETIAIVDDDESMRSAVKTLIESIGLNAEDFSSGEDFLTSGLAQSSACLILDVRMPGIGGLELQRRLAACGRPLPIIFITAHCGDEERTRAMEAGAVDFLQKPFSEEALFRAITASLRANKGVAATSSKDAQTRSD